MKMIIPIYAMTMYEEGDRAEDAFLAVTHATDIEKAVDILVTKQTKPLFNAVLNADGFVEDQFSELAYQVMFEDWYGRNVSINYMQNGNMAYAACGETQFIVEKYEVFVPMTNVELAADAD